jgi:hypothetical protein
MKSIRIKNFAVVCMWTGWRFWRCRSAWYLRKWEYFSQASWKHGSLGLGVLKIVW